MSGYGVLNTDGDDEIGYEATPKHEEFPYRVVDEAASGSISCDPPKNPPADLKLKLKFLETEPEKS